jgi:hypothetical protein
MWRGALLIAVADGKWKYNAARLRILCTQGTNITVGEHKTQPWPKVLGHSAHGRRLYYNKTNMQLYYNKTFTYRVRARS